jgi:GGDEF domain-containing protein
VVLVDDLAGTLHASTTVVCQLKADAYTAVVPCVVLYRGDLGAALIDAGADEAIDRDRTSDTEGFARVVAAVRRSTRDLAAQPTTHLPGAGAIEAEIERRLHAGVGFAACYADLDHFKEFNDRYGFHEGDRVIRMLGRLLHDTAAGLVGPNAFVGHVGGDDFMLVVPAASAADLCGLVLEVFDALVPYQYTDSDRRAGYYFGKDRRGQLHRVPLMTLSIGVATTERRDSRPRAR